MGSKKIGKWGRGAGNRKIGKLKIRKVGKWGRETGNRKIEKIGK